MSAVNSLFAKTLFVIPDNKRHDSKYFQDKGERKRKNKVFIKCFKSDETTFLQD